MDDDAVDDNVAMDVDDDAVDDNVDVFVVAIDDEKEEE